MEVGFRSSRSRERGQSSHYVELPSSDESSADGGSASPTRRGERRTRAKAWALEDAMHQTGLGRWHWWLIFACGWANASDAVEVLCVSLVLHSVQFEFQVCSWDLGLLTAVVFVGMMLGGYFWGSLGDSIGRRPVMVAALAVNGLFGFLSAFMTNFWAFFFFRFLSGVGVGGSIPVIWSYFCEFQPTHLRGRMLSVIASFWMLGSLIFSGIGWLMLPHDGLQIHFGGWTFRVWRIYVAISTLLCFSSSVITYFLPESPKFLLEKGRKREALEIMAHIFARNTGNSPNDFPVRRLADAETTSVRRDLGRPAQGKLREMLQQTLRLFQGGLLRTTLLVIVINFSLSFGSYGLTFWLPELFSVARDAGGSGTLCERITNASSGGQSCAIPASPHVDASVYRDTFLINLSSLPGNVFTIFLLDRLGRRPVFVAGAALSALSVLGIFFVGTQAEVLGLSCLFNATGVLCWNCLDAFSIELFPTSVRATAMGLGLGFARIGAILGNTLFGLLVDQYCSIPILLVAAMLAVAGFSALFLKETSNVPLD